MKKDESSKKKVLTENHELGLDLHDQQEHPG